MSEMPFILSNRDEDRKIFEAMINKTMASFFRTMGDGKAFSGIDPYSLRRKVNLDSKARRESFTRLASASSASFKV